MAGYVSAQAHHLRARRNATPFLCEQMAKYTDEQKEQFREYKRQGHTSKEIAQRFNIPEHVAKDICRGVGAQYVNQYTRRSFDNEEHARIKIAEYLDGKHLEYVGGFTGCDGRVNLRCTECGAILNRSMVRVRQRKVGCDKCRKQKQLDRIAQKEIAKEERRRQRKKATQEKQKEKAEAEKKAKQERQHSCAVCGAMTMRPKYCSKVCANKAKNKRKEVRRRHVIAGAMIDNDITLEALYKRDGGACHICGMQCNYDDYIVKNDAVITGDYYPSIDHVIPLSKGGAHSWTNVKLAHRRCNTFKSDKTKIS